MKRSQKWMIGAALTPGIAAALFVSACGGASAKSAASPSAAASDATAAGAGRRGNRTPSPDALTSIAEGTPRGSFGNRTPPPAVQTSIAEGTPFGFGMRTPSPAFQTAIAEGTPIAALRGQGGGGRNIIATVAAALSIDPAELQTELQAPGATIANVAAKHDVGRETIKSALIAATQQRLSDAVASGAISQDTADQSQNQFAANIDALLDAPGGSMGMPPPGQ